VVDVVSTTEPIWSILEHQGRTMRWLADRIDYSISYVKQFKYGQIELTDEFKKRCARALDLPVEVLFLRAVSVQVNVQVGNQ